MPEDDSCSGLVAAIEAEQLRLREVLSGKDPAALVRRPPSDKWSVMENVRHLVFAEYVHLSRFVTGGLARGAPGLPPHNMQVQRQLKMVGSAATSDIREVLETWAAVHESTRDLALRDGDELRKALTRHLRHLRAHARRVESLLRPRG